MSAAGVADLARGKDGQARAAGADGMDLGLSRESGMAAQDIMNLRRFTASQGLMIVFRCPKRGVRGFHGTLPAKTWAAKSKTNETGTVAGHGGIMMVSDYDMMSMWKRGAGWEKIYVSALARGASRGPWSKQAGDLVRAMNMFLLTRIQHGCQDDFYSADKNPGVKMADYFLAIAAGDGIYLPDPVHCENFYRSQGLFWPYGHGGRHLGHGPGSTTG